MVEKVEEANQITTWPKPIKGFRKRLSDLLDKLLACPYNPRKVYLVGKYPKIKPILFNSPR